MVKLRIAEKCLKCDKFKCNDPSIDCYKKDITDRSNCRNWDNNSGKIKTIDLDKKKIIYETYVLEHQGDDPSTNYRIHIISIELHPTEQLILDNLPTDWRIDIKDLAQLIKKSYTTTAKYLNILDLRKLVVMEEVPAYTGYGNQYKSVWRLPSNLSEKEIRPYNLYC